MNNEINVRTLKECDDDLFPNIYVLLKIRSTIPAKEDKAAAYI